MSSSLHSSLCFGSYSLCPATRELLCDGELVTIGPMLFDVLTVLAMHNGDVVSREELLREVWGTNQRAGGSNVNQSIWLLRKALGPDGAAIIETVPHRGYRLNAEVRKSAPSARSSIKSPNSSSFETAPKDRLLRTRSAFGVGIGFIGLLAIATATLTERAPRDTTSAATSVAVLQFSNLDSSRDTDDRWLSTALAHLMELELGACECMSVLPQIVSGRAIESMKIDDAFALDATTMTKLSTGLGVDAIIQGSFLRLGGDEGTIRIDVRIANRPGGDQPMVAQATGRFDALGDVVGDIGEQILAKLGAKSRLEATAVSQTSVAWSNPASVRLLAEAMVAYRSYDTKLALDRLSQAIDIDPTSAFAHNMLAEVHHELGHTNAARASAKLAMTLSETWRGLERKRIEANFHWAHRELDQAIRKYTELYQQLPQDVDIGLRLAVAHEASGHARAAEEVINQLRALPPSLSDDPRIQIVGANILRRTLRARDSIAWAIEAGDRARETGAGYLAAKARLVEARGHMALGDFQRSLSLARSAAQELAETDNQLGQVEALIIEGRSQRWRDARAEMEQAFDKAYDLAKAIGSSSHIASITLLRASSEAAAGNVSKSESMKLDALAQYRALNDNSGVARALHSLGLLYYRQKNLEAAETTLRSSIAALNATEFLDGKPMTLALLADVLQSRARFADSYELAIDAVELNRLGNRYANDAVIAMIAGAASEGVGNLENAETLFYESLAILSPSNPEILMRRIYVRLARIRADQGQFSQAVALSDAALIVAQAMESEADMAYALSEKARVLADIGDFAGAQQAALEAVAAARETDNSNHLRDAGYSLVEVLLDAGRAEAALAHLQNMDPVPAEAALEQLAHDLLLARAQTATGQCAISVSGLEDIAARSRKGSIVRFELEAGLALSQCDQAAGDPQGARVRLAALAIQAAESGFHRYTRLAKAMMAQ